MKLMRKIEDVSINGCSLSTILRNHAEWNSTYLAKKPMSMLRADLYGADLHSVDLSGVDLHDAILATANLHHANLSHANLREADLRGADLRDANLYMANLFGALLSGADLKGANTEPNEIAMSCPSEGSFIGWTWQDEMFRHYLIKLQIPEEAKRCSDGSPVCRCNKASVLDIIECETSEHKAETCRCVTDPKRWYVGQVVQVNKFDDNRWSHDGGLNFCVDKHDAYRCLHAQVPTWAYQPEEEEVDQ